MARLTVPTCAKLPSYLRIGTTSVVVIKCLQRLSRDSLLALALDWLEDGSALHSRPFLRVGKRRPSNLRGSDEMNEPAEDDDETETDEMETTDDLYPPCRTIPELREQYADMQSRKGSKSDVVGRILEGDWRHGLTLYQLATADMYYFDEHPASQTWSTYQIHPREQPSDGANLSEALKLDKKSLHIPRFHPSTFLQGLQAQVLPDVKAHYHFHRPKNFPLLLLRILVLDSPYNTSLALTGTNETGASSNLESSRTIYLAFPDGSPSLYISKSSSTGPVIHGDAKSMRDLIVQGVPKALSRPRERYALKSMTYTSKNLSALLGTRGIGRGNAALGGWSIYAQDGKKASPLNSVLPSPPLSSTSSDSEGKGKRPAAMTESQQAVKRAKMTAQARFGDSALITDGKGVERFNVMIQDPFSTSGMPIEEEENSDEATGSDARNPVGGRKSWVTAAIQEAEDSSVIDTARPDTTPGWTPNVHISFQGPHVFAGIRQLVEAGILDGERLPGWMTGEEGVTNGLVRSGRIHGFKGSGLL